MFFKYWDKRKTFFKNYDTGKAYLRGFALGFALAVFMTDIFYQDVVLPKKDAKIEGLRRSLSEDISLVERNYNGEIESYKGMTESYRMMIEVYKSSNEECMQKVDKLREQLIEALGNE